MSIFKKAKDKVIDVASDVIADNFMGARKNRQKANRMNQMADDMKLVRETKDVSLAGKDYRDPIFRARANVSAYEAEYANKRSQANRNK